MPGIASFPPPAYFLSLSLENVRSFGEKQTIWFTKNGKKSGQPAQWTIILGDNGVGKTTLLKSLASLMPFSATDRYHGGLGIMFASKWRFLWSPVRYRGENAAKLGSKVYLGNELSKISSESEKDYLLQPKIRLAIPARKSPQDIDGAGWAPISPALADLICYGYGASRTTGQSALGDTSSSETCITLFDEHADLLNAEEWFLQADYRIKSDNNPLIKQNFELLKKALIDILDEVTEVKVSPVAPGGNPQQGLQFSTPYGWVRLREMSLGYQTMAVWITDFASKLFIRYPESKNPLAEPAIVLIDEIDLHLHPEWQRKVIGYLSGLFPNTQFIATAHSPLVVQAASDAGANVVLLRRQNDQTVVVQNLEDVRGWRVDQILSSELFDETPARSPDTEEKLTQRRQLLAKKKLTKADQQALAKLNTELPPLPFGDTPEVQQADAIVQGLLQKLGKLPKPA